MTRLAGHRHNEPMFTGQMRLLLRYRWIVVLVWLLLFLIAGLTAPRVFSVLTGGGFDLGDAESDIALQKLEVLGLNQTTMEAVFHSDTVVYSDPAYSDAVRTSLAAVEDQFSLVSRITAPTGPDDRNFVSPDGRTAYAIIWIDADLNTAQEMVPDVRAALGDPDGLEVHLTGSPALFREIEDASERDLQRGETITLPIVLILLLIVFGSVVAGLLPIAMGVLSVTITLAIIFFVGSAVDMSIFTVNIASFLGLGVAIDYSLLLVSRYREELEGHDPAEAVTITMNTAGKALLFSALTTMIGLSGLLMFNVTTLRSVGIGGMIVVAVSLLMALTLMPVLLFLLKHHVNALPILPRRVPRPSGFWEGAAHRVMRSPLLFILPISAVLLLLGTPFLHVRLGAPPASTLPTSYDSRQGWDLLTSSFGPGAIAPVIIAVEATEGIFHVDTLAALKRFTTALNDNETIERIDSIVDLDARLTVDDYANLYQDVDAIPFPPMREAVHALATENVTMVRLFTGLDGNDPAAEEMVRRIRDMQPRGGGLTAWTTGYTAGVMDLRHALYTEFPKAIAWIFGSIYITLLILFRSVILPLKAILMNGVSIFASFGALVFIFQDGNFEGLLGFTAVGQIDMTVPIILFCILFGLSMDYEVFLLARIKESYDATGDNTTSVAVGLARTGRIITSAALVVILVLAGFAFGDLVLIKALGVSMAIAIAIDVSVVRVVLVPALMRLLGDLNWWAPRFIRGHAEGRIP